MNRRIKPAIFAAAGTGASVLFYFKFEQNIKNIGLLNFIGIPTIVVVALCHGIAFLIRTLLVRRHCRFAGIQQGNQSWVSDLRITNKVLFSEIRKSYLKAAALLLLFSGIAAGIAFGLLHIMKNIPQEEVEHHLTQYFIFLSSFMAAMVMLFFVVHFLLMSFLLEYKNRAKGILVSLLAFLVVFLIAFIF